MSCCSLHDKNSDEQSIHDMRQIDEFASDSKHPAKLQDGRGDATAAAFDLRSTLRAEETTASHLICIRVRPEPRPASCQQAHHSPATLVSVGRSCLFGWREREITRLAATVVEDEGGRLANDDE